MALVPLSVRIAQEELDFLDQLASQHEGILSKQGVVRLLLQQAASFQWDPLDRPFTLGVQSAAGTPSSSNSSIPKSKNKTKSKSKGRSEGKSATIYPPEFEAFWRAYQQLPEKAGKQSKPLALAAWEEVVEEHGADQLIRAAELQLEVQQRELQAERAWTVAMPDCFRWLRDECFVVLLEGHTPAQAEVKPSWML
jgi:hypothetical protein